MEPQALSRAKQWINARRIQLGHRLRPPGRLHQKTLENDELTMAQSPQMKPGPEGEIPEEPPRRYRCPGIFHAPRPDRVQGREVGIGSGETPASAPRPALFLIDEGANARRPAASDIRMCSPTFWAQGSVVR